MYWSSESVMIHVRLKTLNELKHLNHLSVRNSSHNYSNVTLLPERNSLNTVCVLVLYSLVNHGNSFVSIRHNRVCLCIVAVCQSVCMCVCDSVCDDFFPAGRI